MGAMKLDTVEVASMCVGVPLGGSHSFALNPVVLRNVRQGGM